jgi:hypothetical protein
VILYTSIWKYELHPDSLKLNLPVNAQVLSVDEQFDKICLWCEVDPTAQETELRIFEIYGTGHRIEHDMGVSRDYIGTVKLQNGRFIFHIYERLT